VIKEKSKLRFRSNPSINVLYSSYWTKALKRLFVVKYFCNFYCLYCKDPLLVVVGIFIERWALFRNTICLKNARKANQGRRPILWMKERIKIGFLLQCNYSPLYKYLQNKEWQNIVIPYNIYFVRNRFRNKWKTTCISLRSEFTNSHVWNYFLYSFKIPLIPKPFSWRNNLLLVNTLYRKSLS
jgi:hypothetical protein